MLYALLGMSCDPYKASIIPNYKSPEEIFKEFTVGQLQQGSLQHLSATTYMVDNPGQSCLPSWVPDWTVHFGYHANKESRFTDLNRLAFFRSICLALTSNVQSMQGW
jgi:hypothetical protein